jgi:hypothetical protein
MQLGIERLGTGGLDRGDAVGQHRAEYLDHLAVAVLGGGKLAADPLDRGR